MIEILIQKKISGLLQELHFALIKHDKYESISEESYSITYQVIDKIYETFKL